MRVIFRTDASLQIGIGHVMRCLTLADALRAAGTCCAFICREHKGNLIRMIAERSYSVFALPVAISHEFNGAVGSLAHAHWLAASQEQDAEESARILANLQPDCLIVDHYGIGARWEMAVKSHCSRLMVIDDLSDRRHDCDLLLNQNFGSCPESYHGLVPNHCVLLCGSQYALLRPEFAALRARSLRRRNGGRLGHLLITLGGVDKDNATCTVLQALLMSRLPYDCRISVVLGTTAPWLTQVRSLAAQLPWPVDVQVGVAEMAALVADCDLAIGSGGSSSWERCCLGVPALTMILAENQVAVVNALSAVGAIEKIESTRSVGEQLCELIDSLLDCPEKLMRMALAAASVTTGLGTRLVAEHVRN